MMKIGDFSFDDPKKIQDSSPTEWIVNIYRFNGHEELHTGVAGYGYTPNAAKRDAERKSRNISQYQFDG